MTKEHWTRIEMLCEDIEFECQDLLDSGDVGTAVNNLRSYNDDIYSVCESDYCDHSKDDLPHGYEEIWPMLPEGNSLSVGDMNRLKEHIQAWKEGR
jgi:hypothetical protein